jgi:hypothetical protein
MNRYLVSLTASLTLAGQPFASLRIDTGTHCQWIIDDNSARLSDRLVPPPSALSICVGGLMAYDALNPVPHTRLESTPAFRQQASVRGRLRTAAGMNIGVMALTGSQRCRQLDTRKR